MSNTGNSCCLVGRGKVMIKDYFCATVALPNPTSQFKYLGNISVLKLTPQTNVIANKDYTTRSGGDACQLTEITSLDVEMTINCAKTDVLKLAWLADGAENNVAAGTVTDESLWVTGVEEYLGFVRIPDVGSLVVTDNTGGTTFVLGTDYELKGTMLYIPVGSTIPAGSEILVDYTYAEQTQLDLLKQASKEIEIYFDGINLNNDAEKLVGNIFKVKLAPLESFDFISDEFTEISLKGTAFSDETKSGLNGLGQYASIKRV